MTPRTLGQSYRGTDSNLNNMIFLSLICHLVVVTIILVSIPTASRHLTFGPVYSVQLVGAEVALPHNNSSLLKNLSPLPQTTDSIIIKRKINSIYSTPVRNQDVDKLNVEKAVGAIRQKEQSRVKNDDAVAASVRSNISDVEVNAQANEYIGVVWSRIKQNWTMPQSLMPAKNITTIIDVKILRSGALEYAGFEQRSGNSYFDESALRAVKKSSPFPPLPYWVKDNSIEIGIRFHSAELR